MRAPGGSGARQLMPRVAAHVVRVVSRLAGRHRAPRTSRSCVGIPVAVVDRVDGRVVVCAASAEARRGDCRAGAAPSRSRGALLGTRGGGRGSCGRHARVRSDRARDRDDHPPRRAGAAGRAARSRRGAVALLRWRWRARRRWCSAPCTRSASTDARVGIADGPFAARLAARRAPIPDTRTSSTAGPRRRSSRRGRCARCPADAEPDADVVALADLLVRLGVKTLGAFAALPASAVLARFGTQGARLHRLASGIDEHPTPPAPPPPDLVETAELDPPATRVDEAAFVAKSLADRLLARLAALGLSCVAGGGRGRDRARGAACVRCWRHEGALTPAALVDRVRWQLEGWLTGSECEPEDDFTTAGLTLVRLVPEQVTPADGRQLGFWGGDAAARDRADRVLARLQGLLGHDVVVTAVPCGGRTPAERVRWVPWGDARDDESCDRHPRVAGRGPGPVTRRVSRAHARGRAARRRGRGGGRSRVAARPPRHRPGSCAACSRVGAVRWWPGRGRGSTTCGGGTASTRRRRALWHVVVGGDDTDRVPGRPRGWACHRRGDLRLSAMTGRPTRRPRRQSSGRAIP